jgi:hypothetical protein
LEWNDFKSSILLKVFVVVYPKDKAKGLLGYCLSQEWLINLERIHALIYKVLHSASFLI